MVGLHEDPPHAQRGPVSLKKARQAGVIPGEARGRGDTDLQGFPSSNKGGSPKLGRDWFAMVKSLQGPKGLDVDFEIGTINVIKG